LSGKVRCSCALDRGIGLARQFRVQAPLEKWEKVRSEIRAAILEHGYSDELVAFAQAFDGKFLDASEYRRIRLTNFLSKIGLAILIIILFAAVIPRTTSANSFESMDQVLAEIRTWCAQLEPGQVLVYAFCKNPEKNEYFTAKEVVEVFKSEKVKSELREYLKTRYKCTEVHVYEVLPPRCEIQEIK
jgi:hypothetical protein